MTCPYCPNWPNGQNRQNGHAKKMMWRSWRSWRYRQLRQGRHAKNSLAAVAEVAKVLPFMPFLPCQKISVISGWLPKISPFLTKTSDLSCILSEIFVCINGMYLRPATLRGTHRRYVRVFERITSCLMTKLK